MRLDGRFYLEEVGVEAAWLALSDPHVQEATLPGCLVVEKLDDVDQIDLESVQPSARSLPVLDGVTRTELADRAFGAGDRFATRIELGIGPISHRFDAIVEIVERDFPVMRATGRSVEDDSFEITAGMELTERSGDVEVAWWLTADVDDRLDRLGSTLLDPIADRFVSRYVDNLSDEIGALDLAPTPDEPSFSG